MEWRPLQRRCACPVGRPPKKPVVRYHDFMYRRIQRFGVPPPLVQRG